MERQQTQMRPLREPTDRIAPVDRRKIRKNMPHLSKPQTKALAAFSVGIAEEEGCGLNAAAKKLPFAENPASVERRIQRFIASDKIDNAESLRAMAKWVIRSLPEDKPVVLLVDETSLNDRLKAMAAAVAFAGRSIPVAWRLCPNEDWQMGLVDLITETLGWVRDAMNDDQKAIVIADGGIGNSTSCRTRLGCLGVAGRGRSGSRAWNPDRANRLWLAMALSCAWMASLGAAAFSSNNAVKEVSGGRLRAARSALFRLDVDVFHLCFERGRGGVCSPLFPIGLGRAAKSAVQQAHKGRRDPPTAIQSWIRATDLAADFWIPAFAGMTGRNH